MIDTELHTKVDILATEVCGAYTIKLRSDGIVHSHTSAAIESNVESLKKFTVAMGEMIKHKTAPLLLTLDEFAIPPVDVRAFWATKEACPYASAEAYITDTVGHKLIGNFYLKFNKPGRPTKMFTNEDDAIEWLKKFM